MDLQFVKETSLKAFLIYFSGSKSNATGHTLDTHYTRAYVLFIRFDDRHLNDDRRYNNPKVSSSV